MSTSLDILDIARRLNAVSDAYSQADDAKGALTEHTRDYRELENRLECMFAERLALQNLFPVLEPRTLAETAVYAAMAFYVIDYDIDSDDLEEMRTAFKKTERALVRITRQLAIEAGVDLSQFGETDLLSMMQFRCPEMVEGEIAA
jgi:hypothetical protein